MIRNTKSTSLESSAKNSYYSQMRLLIRCLPFVFRQDVFSLKGGTAINLFLRDFPRMSVDIDLTYLPIADRKTSLDDIMSRLKNIQYDIDQGIGGVQVYPHIKKDKTFSKLVVVKDNVEIKIEVNEVLRGTVYSPTKMEAVEKVQDVFESYISDIVVSSKEDVYAGKICAALDRQHPRDFYDVYNLLNNEGLSERLLEAFVIYLASNNRPMFELLEPNLIDFKDVFYAEFKGMAEDPVSYDDLISTRYELIRDVNEKLTDNQRQFLLSIKKGEPNWELSTIKHAKEFPAIQWKLMNIKKMPKQKHEKQYQELKRILEL